MKVALVLAVLCLALGTSDAWLGGRFRGGFGVGFGRLGLGGWGWGAPWRWGLGPWGLGPLGWGGLGVPAIPAVPAALGIGKRAADAVVPTAGTVMPTGIPMINNDTTCTFAEKNSIFACLGNTFSFECSAIPTGLADFTPIRTQNLTVVLDERVIDGVHLPIFRLFSRTGHVLNNFSIVSKKGGDNVVFSIYNSDQLTATETGIRIKDTDCWTAFVRAFHEVVPNLIDFDFVETHVSVVPATAPVAAHV